MERYFKVEKDSKTGRAFMEIMARKAKFDDKAKAVCDKYGIRQMYCIGWDLCGVHTCKMNTTPDKADWKKVDDGYMPKVRSKNKELLADFAELHALSIRRDEVDLLLGQKNPFHQVGFDVLDDCIVFTIGDDYKIRCADAKEISNMAYSAMRKNDKGK